MPTGWGLRVTLETPEGETFTEYDTLMWSSHVAPRDRVVSAKVRSQTNQTFRIRIEGKRPLADFDAEDLDRHSTVDGPPTYRLKVWIDGKRLDNSCSLQLLPKLPLLPTRIKGQLIKDWNVKSRKNSLGEQLYQLHKWVFTDIGIDVRLAQLDLQNHVGDGRETLQDSDTELSRNDVAGPNNKKGTIEVRVERYIETGRT